MVARDQLTPKVMVVSNLPTTGPLWVMSLQHQLHLDVILESAPANILSTWAVEIPDLIIFDVNLPATSILDRLKQLRSETAVPILLFTTNSKEEFLVEAYNAGVDECIIKPIGASLFHAKIKVWLRRSGTVPAETLDPLKVGNFHLAPAEKIVILENGLPVRLTNLEMRLMYCIMSQPGRTISTEVLIQRIWGLHSEGDTTALKNIIYRLRHKIEKDPASPKIIQTVVGIGYRFAGRAG